MNTEIAQTDPKFLPAKMGVTDHKLRKLRKEFDAKNLPTTVVKGDDNYAFVHAKAMEILKVRTGIEAVRKELKADALAWGRTVDTEAKRLTAAVEAIEEPWKAAKQAADDAQARAEEEARQAEQKRVEAIEAKVVQLKVASEGLLNANSAAIKSRLDKVQSVVITEDEFEEFYDAAVHWHQSAMETLTRAYEERVVMERQKEELAEAQRKIEEQQAECLLQLQIHQDDLRAAGIQEAAKESVKETEAEKVAPVSAVVEHEPAGPSEFESWWFEIGRNVKPEFRDGYHMESFRERLALAAWEAASE